MPTRIEQARCDQAAVAALVTGFNLSAPGANTNILATSIKVSPHAVALRITVCLATASVFNVMVSDGTTTFALGQEKSTALNAGDSYTFTLGARRYKSHPYVEGTTTELTYNFQVETDGVIRILFVEEVLGPVV